MPAKTPEAIARKKTARKVREAAQRQLYQQSKQEELAITVDPIPGWQKEHWTEGTQLQVIGEPQPGCAVPNLTLMDGSNHKVIVQRLAPTSWEVHRKAKASSKAGRILLDAYLAKKTTQTGKATRSAIHKNKRNLVEHHLGIWHSRGEVSLGFTSETTNPKYRDEAFALLWWTRQHAELVLTTLKDKINTDFASSLAARAPHRRWLESYFGKSTELLHPWWTTVAFFTGFPSDGGVHRDDLDCIPSLLFNFGEPALLALPQFGVSIRVEPHTILVLNSHTYFHRSLQAGGNGDARWAFSGFFRQSIFNEKPLSIIAGDRLDALLASQ